MKPEIKFQVKAVEVPEEVLEGDDQGTIIAVVMLHLNDKGEDPVIRKRFIREWLQRDGENAKSFCKRHNIQLKKARSKPNGETKTD